MTSSEIGIIGALAGRLDAYGVRGTPCGMVDGTPQCRFEPAWLSLAHQPAHRAFRVTGCGINKKALHWLVRIGEITVEALTKRSAAISAIKAELID